MGFATSNCCFILLSSHSRAKSLEDFDATISAVSNKIKDNEWINHCYEDITLPRKNIHSINVSLANLMYTTPFICFTS